MFGKGILYVIGFPFFVLALVIFGAIGVFLFAFQLIKSIFYFFTGRKFFPELPEDKELRLLKEKAQSNNDNVEQSPIDQSPIQQIDTNQAPVSPAPAPTPVAESPQVNNIPVTPVAPVQEAPKQGSIEQAVFIDLRDEEPMREEPVVQPQPQPQPQPIKGNVFEELNLRIEPVTREETPARKPEPAPVEVKPMREQTIEIAQPKVQKVEQEQLEEYVPKGSTYVDDYDEEDTGNGVSIDYDL